MVLEHHKEASQNKSSAQAKEEANDKHSLILALICTGHEINFSLQNSLTIASIIVIPLVLWVLAAFQFKAPVPPAIAIGLLVPLWYFLLKSLRHARSRASVFSLGAIASILIVGAGFGIAWPGKLRSIPPPVVSAPPASVTPKIDTPPASDRVFLPPEIDYRYLTGLYRQNASFQADAIAANYMGKWMRMTVVVEDLRRIEKSFIDLLCYGRFQNARLRDSVYEFWGFMGRSHISPEARVKDNCGRHPARHWSDDNLSRGL